MQVKTHPEKIEREREIINLLVSPPLTPNLGISEGNHCLSCLLCLASLFRRFKDCPSVPVAERNKTPFENRIQLKWYRQEQPESAEADQIRTLLMQKTRTHKEKISLFPHLTAQFCHRRKRNEDPSADTQEMERAARIIRRSVHSFLKNIDSFNAPILILLPYSASLLLPRSLLFSATETTWLPLPQSLLRTVFSFAFALTSLAMAKSRVIQALTNRHDPSSFSLYRRLAKLQFLHTSLALAADAIASVPHGFFSSSQGTLLALTSRTVSCAVAANLSAVCDVAIAVAGIENCSASEAIRKACSLRCGESAALLIALPHYLCFAAVEALFQFRYRSVMEDRSAKRPYLAMALEGVVIAWLYSVVVVLDTIACGLYVKSRESSSRADEGASRGHSTVNANDDDDEDDRCGHGKTSDMA